MISFELPDEEEDWQAMDCRGEILPAAVQGDLMLAKVIVPELGYTCVKLQKTGMKIKNTRQMTVTEKRLENELIRVDFNENGNIISIIDKELQREMLAGMANLLLLFDDKPNDWDAWDINHYYRQTEPEVAQLKEIRLHKTDYLWGGLWLDYTIGNSTISQLISLKCESRMIECWTYVNWQEKNKMLKVRAVPDIISQQAAFEIQFGYISRPTHSNTSWEAAKFEVSGHRYADLSQKECGFAIVNDCKYGHYIKDNVMELTLLRSPQNPDPSADAGEHTFRYGWLPHCGELVHSEVFKKAHEFNSDLILQKTFKLPKELNKSFFKLEGKNVKIETIKPAENGEGVILRLYEYYGSESEICLKASRKWKQLSETNLMEKDEHLDCKATDHTKFDFKPFEIRTFRIIF
jgi:alpha-mannosidase